MKSFPTIARILFGLLFFVFGLDGFVHFMPQPKTPIPAGAMYFFMAMMKTGYLFQLVKGTEVVVGFLLLINCFVPLALVVIAPVIVNIVAFNVLLAPSGMGYAMSAIIVALELYLALRYRDVYSPMLRARVKPL